MNDLPNSRYDALHESRDEPESCDGCGDDTQRLTPLAGDLYCPTCHRAGLVGEAFDALAPFDVAPAHLTYYAPRVAA